GRVLDADHAVLYAPGAQDADRSHAGGAVAVQAPAGLDIDISGVNHPDDPPRHDTTLVKAEAELGLSLIAGHELDMHRMVLQHRLVAAPLQLLPLLLGEVLVVGRVQAGLVHALVGPGLPYVVAQHGAGAAVDDMGS